MPYLILGVGLVLGLFLVGRWFVAAKPQDIRKALLWVGAVVVVAIAVFLLVTGRATAAVAVLLGLLPFALRAFNVFRMWKGLRGGGRPRPGQKSKVRTRYLDMALSHDTGTLDGVVIAGRYQGRRLSDLDRDDVISLLGEVADDPQSRQILEAYLDRMHGAEWRDGAPGGGGGRGQSSGRMTVEEARDILGVGPRATDEEIEAAYRAAIKRNHPDAGGSGWLAAKINEAKALLLQR